MDMMLSRRQLGKTIGMTAAGAAAYSQLGRSAALATATDGYRAMVGIFLFGGNDGWNTIIPYDDSRYAAYASARNSQIVLAKGDLVPLTGSTYALNPALQPLQAVWNDGGMNVVLNTGTLYQPLTKDQYQNAPNLRPVNLMSHADEQAHWQGQRAREASSDGYMGRIYDRSSQPALPSLISFYGSNLISMGQASSPLVLPSSGSLVRKAASTATDLATSTRNSAMSALADGSTYGTVTATTATGISAAFGQATTANALFAATSSVDQYFVNPTTGAALSTDIANQLKRVARMIEARGTLGHSRQSFFVGHGSYDTHTAQLAQQKTLLTDLGLAIAAFYNAMKGLGLSQNVTAFTMSDFGRVYAGNAQAGSDHAWGNNHLVIGGAIKPKTVHGAYPSQVMGGADDAIGDGRFIPTIATEEYLGAIAQWHGVATADMPYVFPNWATWTSNGRGPIGLFA
ncbi:DUF1501 domain-containing protein [Sphingomonas nostoxanthinifaciens]|uniref:DUF1501 domain-containing protein n=1 Tax=Sphingomonas nostoxanthinifaciens TaxID=2872652 RepID=UPI001CC1E433|nr:DUF1501 domain-containing protein [Sphingomonas nostoxanthinifaciens]UAK24246.1 DUF1501 domain-containing protein [Sphingomonas nostoxanthinifaciens]